MEMSIDHDEMLVFSVKIRVIGVGGAGGNAVASMIDTGLSGVDFIVTNTDVQALKKSQAKTKVQLGKALTRGLGAGAKPEVGRAAAEESLEEIREIVGDADMVFVTAGMGGGTGTGAAPVIAKVAKEKGALTVGVVTKPFQFEGDRRMRAAEQGILELSEHVDSLIVVPNTRLLSCGAKNAKLTDMLAKADDVLCSAVRGITDLIISPGLINADFADIRTVMNARGMALMGAGTASGDQRAINAAKLAISSPFLEDLSIQGAKGIIVNVTATSDLTIDEYSDAVSYITDLLSEEATVVSAIALDETAEDNLTVTVVATGLEQTSSLPTPTLNAPTNKIEFAPQAVKEQREPQVKAQPSLATLNSSQHYASNMTDTNFPAYLRERYRKQPHNPGSNNFAYSSEDETELPAFINKLAN